MSSRITKNNESFPQRLQICLVRHHTLYKKRAKYENPYGGCAVRSDFCAFFAFSRAEYAVLLLTIGGVFSAETFNTSLELLANRVSKKKDPFIRASKDSAAGAVLILAVIAVFIGLFLFGDIGAWIRLVQFYASHPLNLAGIILLLPVSLIFIAKGPSGIAKAIRRIIKRKKKQE